MDLVHVLGAGRQAAICRELTKRFEEVIRGRLGDLAARIAETELRGEVVILVGRGEGEVVEEGDVRAALAAAMATMRMKDAATAVAGALGLPRRQVYQVALDMAQEGEDG